VLEAGIDAVTAAGGAVTESEFDVVLAKVGAIPTKFFVHFCHLKNILLSFDSEVNTIKQ